jgi:hypothetical protein
MKTEQREFMPDFKDPSGVTAGNTNSQFYMWESQNPRDELDFEADLIASTNESVYNNNLEIRK